MASVQDIIGGLTAGDPEAFRRALISQAEMHDDYASSARDARAKQGAIAQRNACLAAYDAVGSGDPSAIYEDLGRCVVALNVACKLTGVPAWERTAAIVDWEAQRAI